MCPCMRTFPNSRKSWPGQTLVDFINEYDIFSKPHSNDTTTRVSILLRKRFSVFLLVQTAAKVIRYANLPRLLLFLHFLLDFKSSRLNHSTLFWFENAAWITFQNLRIKPNFVSCYRPNVEYSAALVFSSYISNIYNGAFLQK